MAEKISPPQNGSEHNTREGAGKVGRGPVTFRRGSVGYLIGRKKKYIYVYSRQLHEAAGKD